MKFTNVKKWLSMLLVVCSMLSLAACGKSDKDPAGDDSEKGTKVAVVFASSGLGDKSFNERHEESGEHHGHPVGIFRAQG